MVPRGSREAVHYLTLAPGDGLGPGPVDLDARRPVATVENSPVAGEPKHEPEPGSCASAGR